MLCPGCHLPAPYESPYFSVPLSVVDVVELRPLQNCLLRDTGLSTQGYFSLSFSFIQAFLYFNCFFLSLTLTSNTNPVIILSMLLLL